MVTLDSLFSNQSEERRTSSNRCISGGPIPRNSLRPTMSTVHQRSEAHVSPVIWANCPLKLGYENGYPLQNPCG